MKVRNSFKSLLAAFALAVAPACVVYAADVTLLKVHHFLPPGSTAQTKLIEPWCAKINKESGGRLKCQIYPAMQLGGTPPQLFDQVKDGVADVVWTMPSYQPGRFLVTEAFELPFITSDAVKASRALWEYATKYAQNEYKGVKPLAFHVHDGSHLHTAGKQIKTMADFKGLKLRAPTREAAKLLVALGAMPVQMPMGQVPDGLAKGVIDGALLPWEVVPALKIQEVVQYHSETPPGTPTLSNYVYMLAMNPAKYNSLPADLKKVVDGNSGAELSAFAGKVWDEAREPARKTAVDHKNTFYVIPVQEIKEWEKKAAPVTDAWVKDVTAKGYDGKKLLEEARRLQQ
ncbi:MAG TPA: TRAP transporter substrate-binding protein [Noviherbaspirillum sp.]|uniref:TRAP transporter substrate-binding protein n=1 Tax=Noviherbaspirillum sp. TaxID=1926288 RepID=UPI002B4603AF|nr:TRAP transporter substrate-binding protein [Noviherbaspirillum sp.]HJV85410.1 TRAP transporter substrate-binding protein [Noviherbaspirillum sp.]